MQAVRHSLHYTLFSYCYYCYTLNLLNSKGEAQHVFAQHHTVRCLTAHSGQAQVAKPDKREVCHCPPCGRAERPMRFVEDFRIGGHTFEMAFQPRRASGIALHLSTSAIEPGVWGLIRGPDVLQWGQSNDQPLQTHGTLYCDHNLYVTRTGGKTSPYDIPQWTEKLRSNAAIYQRLQQVSLNCPATCAQKSYLRQII